MTPELQAQLRSLVNFPTPPGIATRLIALAREPHVEMEQVAEVMELDPALSVRILRVVNSPLYGQRRPCQTLRHALVVLGLNATLTLALSFSLVRSLRTLQEEPQGLDYAWYWRRALLSAIAARALGDALGQSQAEERFLAALLQDIGMLALDRSMPDLYRGIGPLQHDHRQLQDHERRRLGTDHAAVGGWLMRTWNLPESLCEAIENSHAPGPTPALTAQENFNACIGLSGDIADIYLRGPENSPVIQTARNAEDALGIDPELYAAVLDATAGRVSAAQSLFETELLPPGEAEKIMREARTVLVQHVLQPDGPAPT